MALDLKMLEMFNLMDYSLLFVISFNPDYIEKFKDEFIEDKDGELLKPYKLCNPDKTADEMEFSAKNKEKFID